MVPSVAALQQPSITHSQLTSRLREVRCVTAPILAGTPFQVCHCSLPYFYMRNTISLLLHDSQNRFHFMLLVQCCASVLLFTNLLIELLLNTEYHCSPRHADAAGGGAACSASACPCIGKQHAATEHGGRQEQHDAAHVGHHHTPGMSALPE